MKLKSYLLGLMALSVFVLAGCSSDESDPNEEKGFVEAPKCEGTVSVRTLVNARATSTVNPEIDNLTATRCDAENINGRNYYLVSYHGRNKAQIGMVQIVDANNINTVTDELYFDDSRVNYVQSCSNGAVYIGVDRRGKAGDVLCGIVAVKINSSGKFVLPNGATSAQISPYKVNGLSINCMKLANNNALVVASAGNEGLDAMGEENSKSGFTKFETLATDPTKLSVKVDETALNYRGYWVSFNDYTGCSTYTYRKVEGNDLVFYLGITTTDEVYRNNNKLFKNNNITEIEVYRQVGDTNNYGRYASCTYNAGTNQSPIIYVIASTGTKEGGARVFRYTKKTNSTPATLTHTDTWNKPCSITATQVKRNGKTYAYAACGGAGLFKLEVTPEGKLLPLGKYVSDVLTESGTPSSINYVQDMKTRLNVCAGYAGFMTFSYDDERFGSCETRTDL